MQMDSERDKANTHLLLALAMSWTVPIQTLIDELELQANPS
jgi:hypothetical protein